MLLGDILAQFNDDGIAAEMLLRLDDLGLIARLKEEADAQGRALGEFAASSVRHYAANASDEEWVTLMATLGRASDPGVACMRRAFAFVLADNALVGKKCNDSNPSIHG